MFDLGWLELLLIVIVTILVVGPEQMPDLLFRAGRLWRRGRIWWQNVQNEVGEIMSDAEQAHYRREIEEEHGLEDPDPRVTGEEE